MKQLSVNVGGRNNCDYNFGICDAIQFYPQDILENKSEVYILISISVTAEGYAKHVTAHLQLCSRVRKLTPCIQLNLAVINSVLYI